MFCSSVFASRPIPRSALFLDVSKRNISPTKGFFPTTVVSSSSGFGHAVLTKKLSKPISASGDINLPSEDEVEDEKKKEEDLYDVRIATTDDELFHAAGLKADYLFANETLWTTKEKRDLIQKIEFQEYVQIADRGGDYRFLDVAAPMEREFKVGFDVLVAVHVSNEEGLTVIAGSLELQFCCLDPLISGVVNHGFIQFLGVAKDHQRKGVATRMIGNAINSAKCYGAKFVQALVPIGCEGPIALFKKLGFEVIMEDPPKTGLDFDHEPHVLLRRYMEEDPLY